MRKPENTFIVGVHKYLPPETFLHREKMNNPYRSATADWWYSGDALDLWVEYKYIKDLPVRDATLVKPGLSDLQKDWCTARYKEGRHVRVVVGTKHGCIVFRNPQEWLKGLSVGECRARMLLRADFASRIRDHCHEGIRLC